MSRIEKRFADCKAAGRPALVTYVMAGDPDLATSQAIMEALPQAGSDIIEFGMPFSDPMADGVAIQLGGQRSLAGGMTGWNARALPVEYGAQPNRWLDRQG